MTRLQWIDSKRIHTNQKAEGMRYRSAHGTTVKRINWGYLEVANPLNRGERRLATIAQGIAVTPLGQRDNATVLAEIADQEMARPDKGRPKMTAVIEDIGANLEKKWQREAERRRKAAREFVDVVRSEPAATPGAPENADRPEHRDKPPD